MARQGFIQIADADEVEPEANRPLPTKVEFYEGVPEHIKIVMQASRDIVFLVEGHTRLILPTLEVISTPDGQPAVPDVDSVFLHAAIVMLVSSWEAFIEEVACRGFEFLLANCNSPADLPVELRKQVAKEIKADKNELSPWQLAGDGWKACLSAHKDEVLNRTARNFNTPKPHRIDELMESLICLKVTKSWQWSNYDPVTIVAQATRLVEIRGAIAHGQKPDDPIGFQELGFFSLMIQQLATITSNAVNAHLKQITGKVAWAWLRFDVPTLRCNEMTIPGGEDEDVTEIIGVQFTGLVQDEFKWELRRKPSN